MVENEIQFLSWGEFKRMAPSIVQLEITRIGEVLGAVQDDVDVYNALVKARYELKTFVACLHQADRETVEATCASHLQTAMMALSMGPATLDEETSDTLSYILDRLNYVYERIALIY